MRVRVRSLAVLATLLVTTSLPAQTIVSARDSTVRCDYLVLTPRAFSAQVIRLAEHRNASTRDDVSSARVVILDELLSAHTPSDTVLPSFAVVWLGLKWCYNHWPLKPQYIVFVGDDRIGVDWSDSTFKSTGVMPSYIARLRPTCYVGGGCDVSEPNFSDTHYGTVMDSLPPWVTFRAPDIAVGRIPCETATQCSVYIDKLVRFEEQPRPGAWRNRTILVADDMMQGARLDNITDHYMSQEKLSTGSLAAGFLTKHYLSLFQVDADTIHSAAKAAYFEQANHGALWTIYFGHGHPAKLSDELFLTAQDVGLFAPQTPPTIVASFSCSNADFTKRIDSCMSKSFLFAAEGGAVAYIASTVLSYASSNYALARTFFGRRAANSGESLGKSLLHAHREYSANMQYQILGDPALQPNLPEAPMALNPSTDDGALTSLSCVPQSADLQAGTYMAEFYQIDTAEIAPFMATSHGMYERLTLLSTDSAAFSGTFSLTLPPSVRAADSVKAVVYAWNDGYESRAWLRFRPLSVGVVEATSHSRPASRISYTDGAIRIALDRQCDAPGMLTLFDIKGRSVFATHIAAGQSAAFDLARLGIPSARYVAVVRTKTQVQRVPFIFAAR
jgi:hypothetical protein